MKYLFTIFFFCLSVKTYTNAQNVELVNNITIKTSNNQSFDGDLIMISADSIMIYNSKNGLLTFSKTNIKLFRKGLLKSRFEETVNSSVPYFVQTALPNGKGNHYYKNYYIFGNEFNFGVGDNWNMSAGFETASLILDSESQFPILQIGTKYSISAFSNLHTGFSVKYYFNEEGSACMLGTPVTVGNDRTNFTISPNFILTDDEENFGVFSNMSLALGPKTRFVFDYFRIDGDNLSSFVFEYIFNSGFSLSMGVFTTPDEAIPNISFSIPFGAWKNIYIKE